ncbi:MAG TPA: type II secretion system protein [Candidatus Paceibacterota bacterium]|nr:type II secretion system protein [Candidatus Paceibacterota bacterium]
MFHFLNSKKKAFTLVEMLVVVTVIAILSSMILVGMGGARAKARDARRIADLHNIQNVLELYFAQKGKYPPTPTGATDLAKWTSFVSTLTGAGLGVSQIPSDPINDTTYFYRYGADTSGTTYTLGAKLEQSDPALNSDIDGTSNGINCDDASLVYCVKP